MNSNYSIDKYTHVSLNHKFNTKGHAEKGRKQHLVFCLIKSPLQIIISELNSSNSRTSSPSSPSSPFLIQEFLFNLNWLFIRNSLLKKWEILVPTKPIVYVDSTLWRITHLTCNHLSNIKCSQFYILWVIIGKFLWIKYTPAIIFLFLVSKEMLLIIPPSNHHSIKKSPFE